MRWTHVIGVAATLVLVPGCAAWIGTQGPWMAPYAATGRPTPSYYCYDCHGDRYLDPYYDWCTGRGFRYAWDRHPETVRVYRERYVRIKRQNPSYGRYRYPADYRGQQRYREPRDYDSWRAGAASGKPPGAGEPKVREKTRHQPGNKKTDQQDGRHRERLPTGKPRDARPAGEQRPGPPGGS